MAGIIGVIVFIGLSIGFLVCVKRIISCINFESILKPPHAASPGGFPEQDEPSPHSPYSHTGVSADPIDWHQD
jgi:hypothetical protein